MLRPLIALAAAALVACATAPKPPPPPVPMTPPPAGGPSSPGYRGEVTWKDLTGARPPRRVTFDGWRIRGSTLSLTRDAQERWVGTVRGAEVTLATKPGRIQGGPVDLSVTLGEKGAVTVDGTWDGRKVRLVLAPDRVTADLPYGSLDLGDMGSGMFGDFQGLLQISGPPDMPQVVLSLLDVLVP